MMIFLMMILEYTYKMLQRKRSYYILLEIIENFKYIGILLVEKALKNEAKSAHEIRRGKLRQLPSSLRIREIP